MNWHADRELPLSFIIFFVLMFFLLGEQLPALPLYIGAPHGDSEKVHILDLAPGDALHRPIAFLIIAIIIWFLFRTFAWPIAYFLGASLWILEQLTLTPLDQRPSIANLILFMPTFWTLFTLLPYFIYKKVAQREGVRGIRKALLGAFFINLLLFGFFAFQIYILHNSHRYPQRPGQPQTSQSDQRNFQCRPGSPNNPPDCPKPTEPFRQTKINPYLGVPCTSNPNPKFTHDLSEADKIFKVTPPSLVASKNQDRAFLWINKNLTDRVPIYAPTDADLIRGVYKISKSVATIDYDLHFQVSCEVWFFINHVSNPVEKIKNLLPNQPASSTNTLIDVNPPLHFKAGELIGYTTGTAQAHNFDFAVFDLNHNNNLVGGGGSHDARFRNFICPFNLLPPELKSKYFQKLDPNLVPESNCK